MQGDFATALKEVDGASVRFSRVNEEWAWKFRILKAEILLNQGLSPEVIPLLASPLPPSLAQTDLEIQEHIIFGIAYARLGRIDDANKNLQEAERLANSNHSSLTGEVARAFGVVEIGQGDFEKAEARFRQSLKISRQNGDRFLELTALLNLGVVGLNEEHYDASIDWSNEAYGMAKSLHAQQSEEKILGNLAWAYYKMGDFDKSLDLFLQAEQRSTDIGLLIDQVRWLNNLGLVYYQLGNYSVAEDYYRRSLGLVQKRNQGEAIDALSDLALVSVQKGELDAGKQFSDQAFSLAHAASDRADELLTLLIAGQIAARSGDTGRAERILLEVAHDPKSDLSLRWDAQSELAKLYERGHRDTDAEKQFRLALGTVEGARSSLKHEDYRLPFLANAVHLYDDYINFLLKKGRIEDALRAADYSRAQTLAEGLGSVPGGVHPKLADARKVAKQLNATILFYWLGTERSYLWAVTPNKTSLIYLPGRGEVDASLDRYHKAVVGVRDALETANPDGIRLYEMLVAPAKGMIGNSARVVIVPDGSLSNLNFETLLVSGPKPHYWIEDVTILNASSIRLLASSHTAKRTSGKLLLIGDAVAPNREYGDLPQAGSEMANIEEHFDSTERVAYARAEATAPAYLASNPQQFSYIHFVTHGTASRLSPLDSAIVLSKSGTDDDSFKLYARDIIEHPLHADLVTISACYGSGARAYAGEGLVGLSWAFLRAGAHNVIGALWEVSDASTPQLMGNMYGEIKKGRSPESALRSAKLSLLHSDSVFRKPFYWAPFQIYAGS